MNFLKYKDHIIRPHDAPPFGVSMLCKGEVRAVLQTESEIVVQDTGWIPNLITDQGLINMARNLWNEYMVIGSGSSAPSPSDTALDLQVDIDTMGLVSEVNGGDPTWECISTHVGRFNAGVGKGYTVREIGIRGRAYYAGNELLSVRTLIPDVVKAENQILDIYWRLTSYPQMSPTSGQFTINGELFDYTTEYGTMQYGDHIWNGFGTASNTYLFTTGATIGGPTERDQRPSGSTAFIGNPDYDESGIIGQGSGFKETRRAYQLYGTESYIQAGQFDFRTKRVSSQDQGLKVHFSRNSDGAPITKRTIDKIHFDTRMDWGRVP